MALEQLHAAGAGATANEVTAYVFFMDNVIKSGDDARLLGASGVVSNGLGSDEAVAEMFNRLASEAERAARRARGGERVQGEAVEPVARQPRPQPRRQPVGDRLARRRLRAPRPHRLADGVHRAALLPGAGTLTS
ncbi:hypothetical protein OsI_28854 [Oryza sativa Indica Group]|uniref:Uncharacterized protein n=1 Tax=Oryza sativa subsp. indica TaxID=39946 RepID=A2YU47_ORYSI|nr:hypothetical protein OsI_28854 [Oryza sativa Indica Group]